jgi:uncharacterized membrane protein
MTEVASAPQPVIGESRWPMAIAVLLLVIATASAPARGMELLVWTIAGIEAVLLVALIVGDPGRIDRRSSRLRWIGTMLVAFLVGTALLATALLIVELVTGSPTTEDPRTLLIAGAKVWLTNNVAFALLYWQFDGRGPAERAYGLPPDPDLAFPQLSAPDLAPPDWRPRFTDYLYLGFTTANAFSPTDTLPMTTWAKLAMAVQALISFVLVGLVIARAVNAFA